MIWINGQPAAGSTNFFTPTTPRSGPRLAYAVGVFFGFSPFLGLHTILGLVVAFAFNLNRVAVLLGVYSNLPWILPGLLHAGDDAGRGDPPGRRSARTAGRIFAKR